VKDIDQERFEEAMNKMEVRVEAACKEAGHKRCRVIYSAYESDENDTPVDNLDEIAAKGRVVVYRPRNEFFGGEESLPYRSKVLVDPTFLQLAVCANRSIVRTRDRHHVFFEGLSEESTYNEELKAFVYQMWMGS
jgi:hypothetical protein